jgi:hypothetical protein
MKVLFSTIRESRRGYRRTAMATKYQKGTVYLRRQRVKMWYGKYTVYVRNEEGKQVGKRRNIPLCPRQTRPSARRNRCCTQLSSKKLLYRRSSRRIPDGSVTFRWFVQERYIPMREGGWSPAYKKINTYELEHYLCSHFGRVLLRDQTRRRGAPESGAWPTEDPDIEQTEIMWILMSPRFGRGKRKGQAVPRWGKNFLRCRIRPVARHLGIPGRLVTFQVMRRTLGTDLQKHGTLKDAQGALRHASVRNDCGRLHAISGAKRAGCGELTQSADSCGVGTADRQRRQVNRAQGEEAKTEESIARGHNATGPSGKAKALVSA